jgi:hypothetical protein
MKKRIISLALMLALLISVLPIGTPAATVEPDFDLMLQQLREDFFGADADESLSRIYIGDGERVHTPPLYGERTGVMPADIEEQAHIPYAEGHTRWFRNVHFMSGTGSQGKLVKQGTHVNIWVLNNTANPGQNVVESNSVLLNRMVTDFDAIVSRMTHPVTGFGAFRDVRISTKWGNEPLVGDVNSDGRVNILMYNMNQDNTGGYFYNVDFWTDNSNTPIALVHMNLSQSRYNSFSAGVKNDALLDFYNTFAHELQHLLFYMYFDCYAPDPGAYLWLNEALSELAGAFYAEAGAEVIGARALRGAENEYRGGNFSYGDFTRFNNSLKSYGMGLLHSTLMHRRTGGTYATGLYNYFRTFLPPAANSSQYISNETKLAGTSMSSVVGSAFNSAGLTGSTGANGTAAFDLLYYLFMEAFAADGGTIINGANHLTPQKFYPNTDYSAFNLWGLRPALGASTAFPYINRAYINQISSYDLSSRPALTALPSGSGVSLTGYDRTASSPAATHEMMYRLTWERPGSVGLRIQISDSNPNTRYYAAVPAEMPESVHNMQRGKLGAALYPLAINNAVNEIPNEGKPVYLFVVTLNRNLSGVPVTYSWQYPFYGDVNGDGVIDSGDVTMLKYYIASSDRPKFRADNPTFNFTNARVAGGADASAADVSLLQLWIATPVPDRHLVVLGP